MIYSPAVSLIGQPGAPPSFLGAAVFLQDRRIRRWDIPSPFVSVRAGFRLSFDLLGKSY